MPDKFAQMESVRLLVLPRRQQFVLVGAFSSRKIHCTAVDAAESVDSDKSVLEDVVFVLLVNAFAEVSVSISRLIYVIVVVVLMHAP